MINAQVHPQISSIAGLSLRTVFIVKKRMRRTFFKEGLEVTESTESAIMISSTNSNQKS